MEKISTIFIYASGYKTPVNGDCNCWHPDKKDCRDVEGHKPSYEEVDLEDIADSLMKVMRICRLHPWEVKRTKEVIKRSFRHYEEIRFRIDRVPKKRFCKENFLHDLAVEAGMSRMDSQLAYGIVKRAFHAYYHGTGEGGIRLKSYADQMRHRSECLWRHAAKRTAEIFAVYAGLMYSEQMKYEECIECVYLMLFKELQSRFEFAKSKQEICRCKKDQPKIDSLWDGLSGATMLSANTAVTTELFFNKQKFEVTNPTSTVSLKAEFTIFSHSEVMASSKALVDAKNTSNHISNSRQDNEKMVENMSDDKDEPKKKKHKKKKKKPDEKCKCPALQCTKERPPPVITAECSQGPYVCRWIPYEETFPAHCVPCPPMETICPPCDHDDRSCDDECTCTCQICTCPPADEFVEEEHGENLSATGLEDRDTDFCWLAPFRDDKIVQYEVEPSIPEEYFGEEAEEALFECRCTCEYKQRAFPHLFTYLVPFKTPPIEPEEPPVEEPVKPQKPPCGISKETYRCWNEPSSSADEEPACPTCPHIALLAHAEKVPESRLPTVKGISVNVTVKTQHFPNERKSLNKGQGRGKGGKGSRSSDSPQKCAKELEANLKAVEAQKANPQAANIPDNKRKTTSVPAPPTKSVPAKPAPATVPAPSQPTANEATNTQRQSDDRLTKEDILEMLGLKK